jgi:hypothetical protein
VPRSVDDDIDRALAEGGLVLVVGPARAGKTRSCYEALRRTLPAVPLLIPLDADALGTIVADAGLNAIGGVWWLDDLERYLPALDYAALEALVDRDHVVVATLRDELWQSLLQADGDSGEQGRLLLGSAHTIAMPAELHPDERAAGARLYPDVDLGEGSLGAALAAGTDAGGGAPLRR